MSDFIANRNNWKGSLKQKLNTPNAIDILIEEKQTKEIVKPPKKSTLKRHYTG